MQTQTNSLQDRSVLPFLMTSSGRSTLLVAMSLLLAILSVWAVSIGSSMLSWQQIIDALFFYDGSREHIIITQVRLPRILAGLLVGMALAVAGAIMQAITNNPLASPGLLGINSGAAFCVVLAIFFLGNASRSIFVWCAFGGAAASACIVYAISSVGRDGATPLKLALVGAMIATTLASLTAVTLMFDKGTLGAVRQWTVGSLTGTQMIYVLQIAPYCLAGLLLSLLIGGQISTLSLGSDIARSVGQNVVLWRAIAGLCVVLLAGSAVALAGPVGFIGLVVPHIVRLLIGQDQRWILPLSALLGGILLVLADSLFRFLVVGRDIPVGITMAVIGAPFFIYLARYRIGGGR